MKEISIEKEPLTHMERGTWYAVYLKNTFVHIKVIRFCFEKEDGFIAYCQTGVHGLQSMPVAGYDFYPLDYPLQEGKYL